MTEHPDPSSPQDLSEWEVVVAEIVAPHGLRGELRVLPHTEVPERLAAGSRLCLVENDGSRIPVTIVESRAYRRGLIMTLSGCEDRTRAEALRRARLTIHPRMRPSLPDGHYYRTDLLGMAVWTDQEQCLGQVQEVLETGSNDVLVTPSALIPATHEVVERIDFENRRILIRCVPGLLD